MSLKFSPRASLICFIVFDVAIALCTKIYATQLLVILLALALRMGDILAIFRRLAVLNLFVVLVVVSVMIAGDWQLATLIFWRANLIMLLALGLFWRLDYYRIAGALASLGLGGRLGYTFYFCAKFIGMLVADFETLRRTLRARSFVARASMFSYQVYASVVAMLFLRAFQRAEALQKALNARGFEAKFHAQSVKFNPADAMLAACTLASITINQGAFL